MTIAGVGPAGAASFVLALEAGTKVSLQWETDILKPWSGKESRVTNLGAPRQTYDAPAYLVDGEDRDMRTKLVQSAAAGLPFLLGLSYEEMTLSADSSGATVFVNSSAYCDWLQPGQRVLVVGPDGTVASGVVQNTPGYPTTAVATAAAIGWGTWTAYYPFDDASASAVRAFGVADMGALGAPFYGCPGPLSAGDRAIAFAAGSDGFNLTSANFGGGVGATEDFAFVCAIRQDPLYGTGQFVRVASSSTFAGGAAGFNIQVDFDSGLVSFLVSDGTNTASVSIAMSALSTGDWSLLACVLDRATNKIRIAVRSLTTGLAVVAAEVSSAAVGSLANAVGLTISNGRTGAEPVSEIAAIYYAKGVGATTGLSANLGTALANFAASLFPTSIVLDIAPGAAGKKGGKIMPAQAVYLDAQQGFTRKPVHVEHWQLKARAALFGYATVDAMGVGQGLRVFDGRYVFHRGLFVEGTYGDGMHSLAELIDLGGIVSSSGAAPVPDWGREVRLFSDLQAEGQWFKCFVQAVRGRALAFLLPTWRPDFAFLSKTSSTTFKIASGSVSGAGDITRWFGVSAAHKHLQIKQTDGSIVYGKISTVGDNGDGTTTVVLTAAVVTGTPSMISWLELVRFESDTFDVGWAGAMFALTTQARVVQQ